MIEFKIKQHTMRNVHVVEVWMNGKFKAAIYPTKTEAGVRLVSTHVLTTELKRSEIDVTVLFTED